MVNIQKANWGYYARRIDVTHILLPFVKGDNMEPVGITHAILGNPPELQGFVKDLEVTFEYNGDIKNIVIQEQSGGNTRHLVIKQGVPSSEYKNGAHGGGLQLL